MNHYLASFSILSTNSSKDSNSPYNNQVTHTSKSTEISVKKISSRIATVSSTSDLHIYTLKHNNQTYLKLLKKSTLLLLDMTSEDY